MQWKKREKIHHHYHHHFIENVLSLTDTIVISLTHLINQWTHYLHKRHLDNWILNMLLDNPLISDKKYINKKKNPQAMPSFIDNK